MNNKSFNSRVVEFLSVELDWKKNTVSSKSMKCEPTGNINNSLSRNKNGTYWHVFKFISQKYIIYLVEIT